MSPAARKNPEVFRGECCHEPGCEEWANQVTLFGADGKPERVSVSCRARHEWTWTSKDGWTRSA